IREWSVTGVQTCALPISPGHRQMRWFARRLVFYAFAIWVALTINFLLPRLMPGSPIGGLLQHLSSAQLQSNPGLLQTYEALLGGLGRASWRGRGGERVAE